MAHTLGQAEAGLFEHTVGICCQPEPPHPLEFPSIWSWLVGGPAVCTGAWRKESAPCDCDPKASECLKMRSGDLRERANGVQVGKRDLGCDQVTLSACIPQCTASHSQVFRCLKAGRFGSVHTSCTCNIE